jgi:tRNA pseudouridine38-40 synthase
MRIAIKFAYDGTQFAGSQRQTNAETVEGAIIACLKKHQIINDLDESRFQVASRTDAEVSALANVFALNTDFEEKSVLRILNSKVDHCWFYGIIHVPDDFNPRHARSRWYRYHIFKDAQKPMNFTKLTSIIAKFEGTHDFKNFCKPGSENTNRHIETIEAKENDDWIIIDIQAQSFLWHQVRRLVRAWEAFACDEVKEDTITDALDNPDKNFDFGMVSARPLFLMNIGYTREFQAEDGILKKLYSNLIKDWHEVKLKGKLFDYLLENIQII